MIIPRYITKTLQKDLVPGRAVLLMGARRVGKTTLIKQVQQEFVGTTRYYNCDDPAIQEQLTNISLEQLRFMLNGVNLIVFDEAQRIQNMGITIKLIVDEMPEKCILVTGSSSLELSNKVTSPLTGRKKTYHLYPISFLELSAYYQNDNTKAASLKEDFMRFGSYPLLFDLPDEKDKQSYLQELSQDYLYKDALEYQEVRNPEQLRKLLVALALQIGSEVSFTELANIVGVDQKTIVRYIDLLEKSYVIFRLPGLSRNMRTEIKKSRKIYFFDLGIRNALIRNFNNFDVRDDAGGVWENLIVAERIKRDTYQNNFKNYYFWRTYEQKEVDLIEEYSGKLHAYEIKTSEFKNPKTNAFLETYPDSTFSIIHQGNFMGFVT